VIPGPAATDELQLHFNNFQKSAYVFHPKKMFWSTVNCSMILRSLTLGHNVSNAWMKQHISSGTPAGPWNLLYNLTYDLLLKYIFASEISSATKASD